MTEVIGRDVLRRLLEGGSSPEVRRALDAVDAAVESEWTVGRQPGLRWASTLLLKYSMVRERGFEVVGLEALVERLRATKAEVSGVALVREGVETVLIVADRDLQVVLGAIIASPPSESPL